MRITLCAYDSQKNKYCESCDSHVIRMIHKNANHANHMIRMIRKNADHANHMIRMIRVFANHTNHRFAGFAKHVIRCE